MICKLPYLFLFILSFTYCFSKTQNDVPLIEKFSFEEDSLYSLKGSMYLPSDGKCEKIVIFHGSVWHDGAPDFSLTIDTLLSVRPYIQRFIDNKIGVLFLNRDMNFQDRNWEPVIMRMKIMSIKTAASDTEKAIKYLRTLKKYKKIPVGIMGISEAGCSAAIVASKNKDIAFAILISTPGIKGIEEHDYDRTCFYSPMMLPTYFSLIFADSVYYFEKEKFIYKPETENIRIFYDNFYKGIIGIERQIIPNLNNYDSIAVRAFELLYKKWDGTAFKPYYEDLKGEKIQIKEYVQQLIKVLFSPHYIEFAKWDPESYLPKIKCPTLMLYGEKDLNINLKAGVDSVRQIIVDYNLSNFTLKIYSGLDHFLHLYKEEKEKIPPKATLNSAISDSVIVDITNWINKI